jgi:hypothetical protein
VVYTHKKTVNKKENYGQINILKFIYIKHIKVTYVHEDEIYSKMSKKYFDIYTLKKKFFKNEKNLKISDRIYFLLPIPCGFFFMGGRLISTAIITGPRDGTVTYRTPTRPWDHTLTPDPR